MMSSIKNPTRTRILQTTWKLLEDGGGAKVRMSDIAKAAKLSRQAVYLHFPNRAELLIATTLYLDEVHDIDAALAASREALDGPTRLSAWITAWGGYIPTIYGIGKALMAMKDNDPEAAAAWEGRMAAVRDGCAAAVAALDDDGLLNPELSTDAATDALWTLLSVRTWEHLRIDCDWSQERYLWLMQDMAARMLIATKA